MPDRQEASLSSRGLLVSSDLLVPVLGLVVVNVILGTYSVVTGWALSSGIDPLFVACTSNLATFLYLSPFAACLERSKWPERLTARLVVILVLISAGGVAAFQVLVLLGMQRTSPAVVSSMSNLNPGLIFLIACCLRFEKFNVKCKYSAAKAMGTLLCLGGAIAVSLLQQGEADVVGTSSSHGVGASDGTGPPDEWIIGCIYLFSATFIASCSMVLQAAAMQDLPTPLSWVAITSLIGALFTAATQLLSKGNLEPGNYSISTALIASYLILSSAVTSVCMAFQMWCIRKQGPVYVSMFNPIGIVTSTILSGLMLGKFLAVGSLAGVFVIIIGLYTVLWAKRKECSLMPVDGDVDIEKKGVAGKDDDSGIRKPLLSY